MERTGGILLIRVNYGRLSEVRADWTDDFFWRLAEVAITSKEEFEQKSRRQSCDKIHASKDAAIIKERRDRMDGGVPRKQSNNNIYTF